MAVVFRGFLILLGMIIALFGIGADYILPGANPGLNLPQLLIIALGFAIAVAAHRFYRAGGGAFPRRSLEKRACPVADARFHAVDS
ncbi:MAG: hypothetical protein OXI30_16675 [Chloroflexota bacterium]|nr:hypothetical protein [Chloroflexota bacterium]